MHAQTCCCPSHLVSPETRDPRKHVANLPPLSTEAQKAVCAKTCKIGLSVPCHVLCHVEPSLSLCNHQGTPTLPLPDSLATWLSRPSASSSLGGTEATPRMTGSTDLKFSSNHPEANASTFQNSKGAVDAAPSGLCLIPLPLFLNSLCSSHLLPIPFTQESPDILRCAFRISSNDYFSHVASEF